MAKTYRATRPDAKVSGELLQTFINGSGLFSNALKETLASHGIKVVRLGEWYPQQNFLEALRTIHKLIGAVILKQTGFHIGQSLALPANLADLNDPLQALKGVGNVYHFHHRNCTGDTLKFEQIGDARAKLIMDTPYPDEFELGIFNGFLDRMAAVISGYSVEIDEAVAPRSQNGCVTCYVIRWKLKTPPAETQSGETSVNPPKK